MSGRGADPSLYLQRTQWLLNKLGNPQLGFTYVHVAGTAGKGTVSTLIHDMLVRSGKKAGLFTSPFATTCLEKIKIGDRYINADLFADLVEDIKPVLDEAYTESPFGMPSYFEIFFALVLLAFQRTDCEYAVVEVGMGGTYDATNVIPAPKAAVITTIDYDHMQVLGRTLPEIAANKAGIIKEGSHVWTSEGRPELRSQFQQVCQDKGATYHEIDPEIGFYQDRNQAVACAVADFLGIEKVYQEAAVTNFRLPCRFEQVQEEPRVILDGAHNPAKVRAAISQLQKLDYQKLHVVIGMAQDKDAEAMLSDIIPLADTCYYTRFQETHRAALPPKELAEKAGKPGKIFLDPCRALDAALAIAGPADIILCIGSFYLSGDLRTRWYPEERIIESGHSF
jgi:dihydrofolate synthase/folylpolyglutamate synthase